MLPQKDSDFILATETVGGHKVTYLKFKPDAIRGFYGKVKVGDRERCFLWDANGETGDRIFNLKRPI